MNISSYLSPRYFYTHTGKIEFYLYWGAWVSLILGLVMGFFYVPADYKQGDAFRIIYLHVPSAFFSLFVYVVMALMSSVSLIWNVKLAKMATKSAAKLGLVFTLMALVTGSIWGKPMWGTWWIWDARLTSELLMFFLYLGIIMMGDAIKEPAQADKAQALLAIIGVINVPIIHYSVQWWFTLHQGQTLSLLNSKIDLFMAFPLYILLFSFLQIFLFLLLKLIRVEILEREQQSCWLQKVISSGSV